MRQKLICNRILIPVLMTLHVCRFHFHIDVIVQQICFDIPLLITMVYRHDVKLYATPVEYASVFSL